MYKITKYFDHDHANDTTIEYVDTGAYSVLVCTFTSEDPDFGTEVIRYVSNPMISREKMAYKLLREIKSYLDFEEGKIATQIKDAQNIYASYGRCTLYAIESALSKIAPVYKNSKGNIIDVITVKEVAVKIIDSIANNENVFYDFGVGDLDDCDVENVGQNDDDLIWHGVRWFPITCLDANESERIIIIGHWGGGPDEAMWIDAKETSGTYQELVKKLCYQLDLNADDLIFVETVPSDKEAK